MSAYVSFEGNLALVGASEEDTKAPEAGAAYVFDLTTGLEVSALKAVDGKKHDYLGTAIAMRGTMALVGAPQYGKQAGGKVYVFDAFSGAELFRLTPSNGTGYDEFGASLDVDGGRAIVGAPGQGLYSEGVAYVFDLVTTQEIAQLASPKPGIFDHMGWAVALHGDRAILGSGIAHYPTYRGSAWVFDVPSGAPLFELVPSDGEDGARFGDAVALDGSFALVGAPGHDADLGKAYLFDLATGQELGPLTPLDAKGSERVGSAVALDGARALVGAKLSGPFAASTGAVYVFDLASGLQVAKLVGSDGESGDYFGEALEARGGRLIVGASGEDDPGILSGAAYVFEALGCSFTRECDPAVPNSTGSPGVIDVLSCSASQGAQLVGRDLPPDQFGYLLVGQGAGVVQPPGSVGDLCLAGAPIGRYAADVASSGAAGRIATDLVFGVVGGGAGDLPAPPGGSLAAGQTWGFQYWYRDPPSSNFTDLVRLVFQP